MKNEKISSYDDEPNHKPNPRFNKVVVIDDNAVDLNVVAMIIGNAQIARQIIKKLNAKIVMEELKKIKRLDEVPELIFLDLNMPGMNGYDFLLAFNSLPDFVKNKCKIVIVSAGSSTEEKETLHLHPNVIKFITKPMDIKHVRELKIN